MNVISIRSIERAGQIAADGARRPAVRAWMLRALQRHVRKAPRHLLLLKTRWNVEHELERNDHCVPRPPKELRAKLLAAFDRGEALYMFADAGPEYDALMAEARSVVDWLDAVPEWDRHLKRIDRMSYSDAARIAHSWHERLLALAADADDPDVVEELELAEDCGDGCRIVELKGPVALYREGLLMGHCVGGLGYAEAVAKGKARIFSLRDARNRPHVTIEVRRSWDGDAIEASQIKGKGNRPPVEGWAAYVRPFVVARNWKVGLDGHNIGLVTIGGRTYENADDILNAVLDARGMPQAAAACASADDPKVVAWRTDSLTRLLAVEGGVQTILQRRMNEIAPSTRKRLFDALTPRLSDVATEVEEVVVKAPKGVAVERRKAVLPGAFLQALSLGFFAGMEDEVAAVMKPVVDGTLGRIEGAPHHVWTLSVSSHPAGASLVAQIAAFVGSARRLDETREKVRSARAELLNGLGAAIRREAARGERGETPPEGGWAHQLAMLERLKPAAVAKLAGPFGYLM